MKKVIYILSAVALLCSSCAKHDLFDENCFTGNVGPEAYWEIESSAVSAGTSMGFVAQYYSSISDIDHSEAWYNIVETIDATVTSPWASTFSYSKTILTTEEKRVSQLIKKYPHDEAFWSDSLHAYTFEGSFPVSGTLAPFKWVKPAQFDSAKMVKYFGDTYMQEFKDGMAAKMKYADYKKMFIGLGLMDDFKQYTDSTEDKNQGEGVFVYHFPKDAEGNEVVPAEIQEMWNNITFEQLVSNTTEGCYEVEYKRTYSMSAILRVYDVRGVYGTSIAKDITIN